MLAPRGGHLKVKPRPTPPLGDGKSRGGPDPPPDLPGTYAAPASHFPTLGNWRVAEFSLRRLQRRIIDKRAHAEAMFEVDPI